MARFPVIDAFVIDHAFQPIADQLETRDLSIFNLARFLMDGTVAAFVADLFFALDLSDYVQLDNPIVYALATISLVLCFAIAKINRMAIHNAERVAKPGTLNPARFTFFPMRVTCVGFCILDMVEFILQPNFARFFGFLGWFLWLLAAYLASCSRRPGMRKTNKTFFAVRQPG